jgi:hypothetical protein
MIKFILGIMISNVMAHIRRILCVVTMMNTRISDGSLVIIGQNFRKKFFDRLMVPGTRCGALIECATIDLVAKIYAS